MLFLHPILSLDHSPTSLLDSIYSFISLSVVTYLNYAGVEKGLRICTIQLPLRIRTGLGVGVSNDPPTLESYTHTHLPHLCSLDEKFCTQMTIASVPLAARTEI